MHLIIAYAATDRHPAALEALQLPHLQRALQLLQAQEPIRADDDVPWLAHEAVHAQALGWPETGPWPWAAHQTQSTQPTPQAWVSPCHWQIGMDQVVMHPAEQLGLTLPQAQAIIDSLQPLLAEDGLQVRPHTPILWHAQGEILQDIRCASLERMAGSHVKPWLTPESLSAPLRRLQSEAQMLLYHHPVNDERTAQGLLPVNALWFHGAGRPQPSPGQAHTRLEIALHLPTLQAHAQAWLQAWQALDQTALADFVHHLEGCGTGTLSLCSESASQSWLPAPAHRWWQRWLRPATPTPAQALRTLLTHETD